MLFKTPLNTLVAAAGVLSIAMAGLAVAAAPEAESNMPAPGAPCPSDTCLLDVQAARHQQLIEFVSETVGYAFAGIQTPAYGRALRMRDAAKDCGDFELYRQLSANVDWRRERLIDINTGGGLIEHGEGPLAETVFRSLENAVAAGYTQAWQTMVGMDPTKKDPFCETSLAIGKKTLAEPLDAN